MKPIIMLACLFMALSFVMACDDDDDNDDATQSLDCKGDVCTDPRTGLMWQMDWCSPGSVPWNWAVRSCEELVLDGYDDWRLPTISELRSLVQGCDDTATGGACTVTDSCLDRSCENAACDGCNGIPGPNQGCYGNPAFPGECYGFWSISEVEDQNDSSWYIIYTIARIRPLDQSCDDGCEHLARCVRDAE